ncbi:GAF and ANTAR domain-containing protein [Arthrobacter sp. ov118]|uniref:GAF and ANTAR domain-containing protein n=1 Tax=Arthrobacter sp. ov118 TaxID=1761747 RepID=UPI0008E336EF|nr:GAF and ANTAR domain-containing protein [Arthrobacter sp. ov118]SFT91953.1 ANTAR domain-containing protein [Arthrobacter sp. ov118]
MAETGRPLTSGQLPSPTMEQLQDLLLESPGFDEFLLELTVFSASKLAAPEPMLCAISVERDGRPVTVASSSDTAKRMDEKQYGFDDGPCLTALREGRTVVVADLRTSERWHRYSEAVTGDGITSVVAVPINAGANAAAALNCYARSTETFDAATIAAVESYAVPLSRILRLALRVHRLEIHPEGLHGALQSRAVIDAALSLIMAQTRGSREDAAALLQEMARSSKQQLKQIAMVILNGAKLPEQAQPDGETQQ